MKINYGFIEQFNIHVIAGWVRLGNVNRDYIYASFNGEESKKYRVDKCTRHDLTELDRTFTIVFPKELVNGEIISIDIHDADGNPLSNSPKMVITNPNELNKVLKGKNGWLFLTNDSNSSIDFITGSKQLDSKVIKDWYYALSTRKELASSIDCKYLSIIVPEKESIYKDFLPNKCDISNSRPFNQLLAKCANEPFLNLYHDFEKCIPNDSLYYQGDTHWNYYGAYMGYISFMTFCGMEEYSIPFNYYAKRKLFLSGDLITKIKGVNLELVDHVFDPSPTDVLIFKNSKITTDRREEYFNPHANIKKRLMVWHTSSIDWMKPFLLKTFSSICFIWQKNIDWTEVYRYGPDLLVFQSNERFLYSSPTDKNTELLWRDND
jgi:hypothetical protein